MKKVNRIVNKASSLRATNNTQKVLLKLLRANGEWVSRSQLASVSPSASARVRDLRKAEYGAFSVECASARELNRPAPRGTFYYRVNPRKVTQSQLAVAMRLD